jgi:hypothetical protein
MRHGKGNGGELGEERDDVHMRDESGSESDEEQEAPAGRGGPETVSILSELNLHKCWSMRLRAGD